LKSAGVEPATEVVADERISVEEKTFEDNFVEQAPTQKPPGEVEPAEEAGKMRERFQNMSPEEREKMREKFRNVSTEERKKDEK